MQASCGWLMTALSLAQDAVVRGHSPTLDTRAGGNGPARKSGPTGSELFGPEVVFVGVDHAHANLVARLQAGAGDEHAAVDFRRVGGRAGDCAFLVDLIDQ